MKRFPLLLFALPLAFISILVSSPAVADSSHARIVRLSLVQGDVRFASQFHKDSLDDSKAIWEIAPLNLPIREGYAIATDSDGRAEVEFENGAMAFLSANTLIEFYDLSLDDGARITRLIVRQGSAIFYVNPAKGDYFSVTGGDFSVEAAGRTRFRMDNFDDGSNVNVEMGNINVLRNKVSKSLQKGQSYSVNMNDGSAPSIGRATEDDDFDKWVSGRIDAVATATNYSNQYVSSPGYSSGFADLYNYGSFYNVPGYGYGWQPFGVGLGWSPFAYGNWYSDPTFGWSFIGSSPWGWLPYHFGGWAFSPMYGWLWLPTGFGYGGGPIYYRPVTGVWVHNGTTTGLVPLHPADVSGKTPLNMSQGIYMFHGNTLAANTTAAGAQKWSVEKNPPRNSIAAASFATTTQPTRVSRTILSGNNGSRPVTLSRDSSIVYDASQHRFVNGKTPTQSVREDSKPPAAGATVANSNSNTTAKANGNVHNQDVPNAAHGSTVPPRGHISPPTPPSSGGSSHPSSGPTAVWHGPSASSGSHTSASAPPSGHSGGGHH
ncbi:MAG TPA: FecR family protein [Candidatus Acidoferrum sp.]|nr:FecR family protein [Candidatus Acidoferrum sp.]